MTKIVVATITPLPGQEAYLHTLVEKLTQDVRAEPGNLRFEATVDQDGSDIIIFEEYRDDAAFHAHIDMPHTKQFNALLTDLAKDGASTVVHVKAIEPT